MTDTKESTTRKQQFIEELSLATENPVHKRLIESYGNTGDLVGMEAELNKLLIEIIKHGD